jgi:hypothetical protein
VSVPRRPPRRPSPDRAVDVGLAEFETLRAEIVNHLSAQAAVVGLGLTGLGVIIGFSVKEGGSERLLLAIPPLTCSWSCSTLPAATAWPSSAATYAKSCGPT